MATSKELRTKVETELTLGKTPRELEEKYNIPYATINNWKNKMDVSEEGKEELEVLLDTDIKTLQVVSESVKQMAPKELTPKIDKLVEGVTALQQLEPKFHTTTLRLLERAEEFAESEDLTVKDWLTISQGISSLYASMFNKSGNTVNVLNNTNINNEKLSMFKSTMRNS